MKRLGWLLLTVFVLQACDDIIEVEDISNRTVILVAPTDGAILNAATIHFDWESVEDAENYRIQIATPNFEAPLQIVEDATVADSIATTFSTSLDTGAYQWRVRAQNSDYQTNYTTQSFTVED